MIPVWKIRSVEPQTRARHEEEVEGKWVLRAYAGNMFDIVAWEGCMWVKGKCYTRQKSINVQKGKDFSI